MDSCQGDMESIVFGLGRDLSSAKQLKLQFMRLFRCPQQCDSVKESQPLQQSAGTHAAR